MPDAVYVYGVLRAGEAVGDLAAGVQGAEVRSVEHAGLAALVSDFDGNSITAAREIRAHWRVLDQVSGAATVLPTRFGTVMGDDEAVRSDLLDPNRDQLDELLRGVAGCVQLNVSGVYDEPLLMREVVRTSPAVTGLREKVRRLPDEAGYYERIRLGELVAAEVERLRLADSRLALDTLSPLAVDVAHEQPGRADTAFKLSFLVQRERGEEFTDGVNRLASELGDRVTVRYVGPLPPYTFAQADLRSGAWA